MENLIHRFIQFLQEATNDKGELIHSNAIDQMIEEGNRSLFVDLVALENFDPHFVEQIIINPKESVDASEDGLKQVILTKEPDFLTQLENRVHVRFINPPDRIQLPLRKIRSGVLGTLVATEGIITKATEVKPFLKTAAFRCVLCHTRQPVISFTDIEYHPPSSCINADNAEQGCKSKSFTLLKDDSTFIDFKRITLQEKPEELPPGRMPEGLTTFLMDDLCDHVRPGDRVKIVGVLQTRTSGLLIRGKMPVFSKFLEAISIQREIEEYSELEISEEDEQLIKKLSKDPNIHRRISNSIAPIIFGFSDEKEAISYLLFGGTTKTFSDGTKIRGESNILLIGDPGIGKSQILKSIADLVPRGLYTSGRGSTAAGLTAAVIRDPDTGEMTLEAGAVVLADRGVALIDEFDKMRRDDRTALHEMMEQHSYHPNFELSFADKSVIKIGNFVEKLFFENKDLIMKGIDCEILEVSDHGYKVLTTDFSQIFETNINRISRHKAPSHFYKLTYSNGREIIITPEHPIFLYEEGIIATIPANKLKLGMYVPIQENNNYNRKKDKFPTYVALQIRLCFNKLGLSYDKTFHGHIKYNYEISMEVLNKLLLIIKLRTKEIENEIRTSREIIGIRNATVYSQATIANLIDERRNKIDHLERGKYSSKKRKNLLDIVKIGLIKEINNVKQIISNIEKIKIFSWLKIKKIDKIENRANLKTNWVYDITVEPTQNFVSHGLVLHNSVSIAKAGIIATLNARTSILAAANPKLGRWDPNKDAVDNLNLPPTILSRFDLIFPLIDTPNRSKDEEKATYILSIHQRQKDIITEDMLPKELLRKYISYARKNIQPKLSNEAKEEILQFYLDLREGKAVKSALPRASLDNSGNDDGLKRKSVAITPRQLESLIRLSEARAKISLRSNVTRQDAIRVIELFRKALERVTKGDIDSIYGMSTQKRNKREIILNIITRLASDDYVPDREEITIQAKAEKLTESDIRDLLDRLLQDGEIYEPKPGHLKRMSDY